MKFCVISAILFFFLTTTSCVEKRIDYSFARQVLDNQFIDHFPKTSSGRYDLNVVSDIYKSHPHVWLKMYFEEDEIDSLNSVLSQKAKMSYNSSDECLLLIDGHLNSQNWLDIDKQNYRTRRSEPISKNCGVEFLPIPRIFLPGMEENIESKTGLVNYTFFVLEAKTGMYLDEDSLPNGAFTNEGWKHGFSKGVALNLKQNTALFWADVW